jgi:hypothetical protein
MTSAIARRLFVVDRFALRQWEAGYLGTQITGMDPEAFEARVNELAASGAYPLVDGYAPFCKHIFVPNFINAKCDYVKISDSNRHLIQTEYSARTENELPVLSRFIDKTLVEAPLATHLDLILYSREQINLENAAMNQVAPDTDAPWGIICVKGQSCNYETPMQPITMMRNALGREEGGSGVPLDRSKYNESVKFWNEHCSLK